MTSANPSAIPRALQRLKRWNRWHLEQSPTGRPTKRPVGSTKDVAGLLPFAEATKGRNDATQGFGLVFTDRIVLPTGETVVAFDLDACRHPGTGEISEWAREVLDHYGGFFHEVTPSGAGLRQLVAVKKMPRALARTKVTVSAQAPDGVAKKPEFQLFGLGMAQYVTMTGNLAPGSKSYIGTVDNLDWLIERFGLQEMDAPGGALPAGDGTEPEMAVIAERMWLVPKGREMIEGDWHAVLGESGGSASEAYFRLVQHVLRAARGHGEVAVRFLLQCTAWGLGKIEESADPVRYTRESWVRNEVARVGGKKAAPAVEDAFDIIEPGSEAQRLPALPTDGVLAHELWKHGSQLIADRDQDPFLVHGLIPRTGLTQFFGDPASGKTPFALSLAVHVAAGRSTWFGHEIEHPGPVAYMVGEDLDGIAHRLKAEYEALGLDPAVVPLWASLRPGRLSDPDEVEKWVHSIRKWAPGGISAVVIDTQSANFGPANENSNEDAQRFVDNLNAISQHLRCAIILVHHKGHHDKDRGRGAMAVFAGVYCAFDVTRDGSVVQATSVKEKNWAKPDPLLGQLVPKVTGVDKKGREITAITLAEGAPDGVDAFEPIAEDMEGDDAGWRVFWRVEALDGEAESWAAMAKACGTTAKIARQRMRKLVALGLVKGGASRTSESAYTLTEKGRRVVEIEEGKVTPGVDKSED